MATSRTTENLPRSHSNCVWTNKQVMLKGVSKVGMKTCKSMDNIGKLWESSKDPFGAFWYFLASLSMPLALLGCQCQQTLPLLHTVLVASSPSGSIRIHQEHGQTLPKTSLKQPDQALFLLISVSCISPPGWIPWYSTTPPARMPACQNVSSGWSSAFHTLLPYLK